MKNKIVQFIPEHMKGLIAKSVEFEDFNFISTEPWIKNFTDHPNFEGFSVNEKLEVFAKFPNGKQFTVGRLENEVGIESIKEYKN